MPVNACNWWGKTEWAKTILRTLIFSRYAEYSYILLMSVLRFTRTKHWTERVHCQIHIVSPFTSVFIVLVHMLLASTALFCFMEKVLSWYSFEALIFTMEVDIEKQCSFTVFYWDFCCTSWTVAYAFFYVFLNLRRILLTRFYNNLNFSFCIILGEIILCISVLHHIKLHCFKTFIPFSYPVVSIFYYVTWSGMVLELGVKHVNRL